jgi:hypothetical protein
MNLADQRTQIAAAISSVQAAGATVHPRPSEGRISPPCVVIEDVSMTFVDNSKLALVGWTLSLLAPRTAPSTETLVLESMLEMVLAGLSKGVHAQIGFVLQDVSPTTPDVSGYPIHGLSVTGVSNYPNC